MYRVLGKGGFGEVCACQVKMEETVERGRKSQAHKKSNEENKILHSTSFFECFFSARVLHSIMFFGMLTKLLFFLPTGEGDWKDVRMQKA